MTNNERPILDILIPTYNRPARAIEAVDSCLRIPSDQLRVSCHSNGADARLQAHADSCKDPRFRFGFFEENRGVCANLRKLIDQAIGQFVMILSDEDRPDPSGILSLMRDLEEKSGAGIGVALPVIADAGAENDFFRSPLIPGLIEPSLALSLHAWDASYISGTVFHTDELRGLDLNYLLRKSASNAYPHLSIKLFLLARNRMMFVPAYTVVLKGRDEGVGGDAWSHVDPKSKKRRTDSNAPSELATVRSNPNIYGVYARSMQFFALAHDLGRNRPHFSAGAVLLARASLLVTFLRQIFINENNREERLRHARKARADLGHEWGCAIDGVLVRLFFWFMWVGPCHLFWLAYAFFPKARRLCFARKTDLYRKLYDRFRFRV